MQSDKNWRRHNDLYRQMGILTSVWAILNYGNIKEEELINQLRSERNRMPYSARKGWIGKGRCRRFYKIRPVNGEEV